MECGQTSMGMSARAHWETLKFSQEIELLQIQESIEDYKPDKMDVILSHGEELGLSISSEECTE